MRSIDPSVFRNSVMFFSNITLRKQYPIINVRYKTWLEYQYRFSYVRKGEHWEPLFCLMLWELMFMCGFQKNGRSKRRCDKRHWRQEQLNLTVGQRSREKRLKILHCDRLDTYWWFSVSGVNSVSIYYTFSFIGSDVATVFLLIRDLTLTNIFFFGYIYFSCMYCCIEFVNHHDMLFVIRYAVHLNKWTSMWDYLNNHVLCIIGSIIKGALCIVLV